jgi:ABC-type transporter Mla maintaining outer membrane lipid asymmetry ATPase subunit MlaF
MLFQGGALFDSMTVLEENVMFPLNMFTQAARLRKKA